MISVLLLLSAHPQLQPLFTVTIPEGSAVERSIVDASTKNLAWEAPDPKGKGRAVFLLITNQRKIVKLGPGSLAESRDCGAGLISVLKQRSPRPITAVYRFADGGLVSEVPVLQKRIGRVFQESLYVPAVYDLQGKLVYNSPKPESPPQPPPVGLLAWDGKRRLAIIGYNDQIADRKDLVVVASDWRKGQRVPLCDNAFSFAGIIGDPDRGTFAVSMENNQWRYAAGIFTKDLRRLWPSDYEHGIDVTDIGPRGILARRLKQTKYGVQPGGSLCLDVNTGKILWQGKESGTWLGKHVLTNTGRLLDGINGKEAGKLPTPKMVRFVAHSGDLFFGLKGNRTLTVYRITGI